MVGKIPPSDDSNKIQPPESLSFHHDYTSPQQHVMNQHIAELKSLLHSHNPQDPEVQQKIETLRNQIQNEDLPAVGLSNRRKPTLTDAMEYIDKQSGYTSYQENAAKEADAAASSKRSQKSKWRNLAGGAPSAPTKKTAAPLQAKLKGTPPDDLVSISNRLDAWKDAHPGDVKNNQNIFNEIATAITTFETSPSQNSGASLRAFIQADTKFGADGTKKLFDPSIYKSLGSPQDLKDLFTALNIDQLKAPAATADAGPPFKPGFTAFVLKNVPKDILLQAGSQATPPNASDPGPNAIYLNVQKGDPVPTKTKEKTLFPVTNLPTYIDANDPTRTPQPYIYIPTGMSSTRIYYTSLPSKDASSFTELTVTNPNQQGKYESNVNFTGVDSLAKLSTNVSMTSAANGSSTSRNGIPVDRATFLARMKGLYGKYDQTQGQAWLKAISNPDGTVPSGKAMTDPAITGAGQHPPQKGTLAEYLQNTLIPGITQNNPIYFRDDAGVIQKGWFSNPTTFTTASGTTLKIPASTDIDGWFSGSAAAWNPQSPAQWGIAKALSSLVTVGIPPSKINSSATDPVGDGYFTNVNHVKDFYQAPFYNLYQRSMHESGCNAYASDFDDVMGGDGDIDVGDTAASKAFFTVTFTGSTPPGPPGPPGFDPTAAADSLWSHKYTSQDRTDIPAEYQQDTQGVTLANSKYIYALSTYNKNKTVDNWNKLKDANDNLVKVRNLALQQGLGYNLIFGDPKTEAEVTRIIGLSSPLTSDQAIAIGKVMDAKYLPSAPVMPPPPGPTPPGPPTPVVFMTASEYQDTTNEWMDKYNDHDITQGLNKNFFDPISNASFSPPGLNNINDIRNWLLSPTGPGHDALAYITSPDVYNKDPALKALMQQSGPKAAQAALQDLFSKLWIPGQVPTPPGPPPPTQTIGQYKDALNAWLKTTPGESQYQKPGDREGYLRSHFADTIFGKIDSGQIKTVADMQNWLNNTPDGKNAIAGLLSPAIYGNDPSVTQSQLQGLFKTLGITAPVPTPPGPPPPTDDVAKLLSTYPNDLAGKNGMYTQQLGVLINFNPRATPADIASLMHSHYLQYINKLTDLAAHVQTPKFPLDVSQIPKYAAELCQQEWTKAGRSGAPPIG